MVASLDKMWYHLDATLYQRYSLTIETNNSSEGKTMSHENRFGLMQPNGTRKLSKAVTCHPAVSECDFGPDGGSDYKYDVLLKPGWEFRRGRMAGCRTGFFNSAADFKYAEPIKVSE